MDNDPRIRAQAEKLADRNEDWAQVTDEVLYTGLVEMQELDEIAE